MVSLLFFAFCVIVILRAAAAHWGERFLEIFKKPDQLLAEFVQSCYMTWQSYRFAVLSGWLGAPLVSLGQRSGPAQNAAGVNLTLAVHDFWQVLLGNALPFLTAALIFVTLCGIAGLMERSNLPRLVCSFASFLWLLWSGYELTVHTPEHLSGGPALAFCVLSFGVFLQLAVCWGRDHEARVGRLAARLSRILPLERIVERIVAGHSPNTPRHLPRPLQK